MLPWHFFCDYSFWGLFNECNKLSPFRTLIKWQSLTNGLDIIGLLSMVLRERERERERERDRELES